MLQMHVWNVSSMQTKFGCRFANLFCYKPLWKQIVFVLNAIYRWFQTPAVVFGFCGQLLYIFCVSALWQVAKNIPWKTNYAEVGNPLPAGGVGHGVW